MLSAWPFPPPLCGIQAALSASDGNRPDKFRKAQKALKCWIQPRGLHLFLRHHGGSDGGNLFDPRLLPLDAPNEQGRIHRQPGSAAADRAIADCELAASY